MVEAKNKKGDRRTRLSLVASAVLVAILAVSSLWLYWRVDGLQRQVDSLLSDVHVFQHMPDITFTQSNPTSGTKYTVLNTTENTRIIGICVKCGWTVQPTTLAIYLVVDGQNLESSLANPDNDTWFMVYWSEPYANPGFDRATHASNRAFFVESRSIKIEAGVTEGTVSELSVRVKYAIIP